MNRTEKQIQIGVDFKVDAVEYASRANAILGIRDSGKTYTATLIAEQLYSCGIPFFAFDPIGRWRFLRWPARGGGGGFPVVVVGGAAPDLPLTPEEAPKLIRAAMRARISMVIDLYDIKLSKKDWRKIVRDSIETILYENEAVGGGLRHVFLEEAAEFIPQHVRDGNTYAAVEKLARMGGNAGVGVTIINQRAEEVNKAALELCDNLLLHRQRGKNSLLSLRKWLAAGNVQPPKEVTDKIADLPTGQCFAWFRDVGHPVLIKVATKKSFDANRREMSSSLRADSTGRVDVSAFIEQMKAAMAGKKLAAPAAPQKEERQVDEKEADELRGANRRLEAENKALRDRISRLEEAISKNAVAETAEVQPKGAAAAIIAGQLPTSMDAIYEEVRRRAQVDPGLLRVLASRPEIEVSRRKEVIRMSTDKQPGFIASMIAEKFFDQPVSFSRVVDELKRRGRSVHHTNVKRDLNGLAERGFLTIEDGENYQVVPGMKVNIVEEQG